LLHRVFANKNTTEHPHKLSSQIVKERSQLLSWEAGILPTFETLSTTIADLLPAISSIDPLQHTPNPLKNLPRKSLFHVPFSDQCHRRSAHYTHRLWRRKKNFYKSQTYLKNHMKSGCYALLLANLW
jgi:hypothetical protein